MDSDSNIDDIRALAILAQYYRIAAVISTAGMQHPNDGAATLAHFLASAGITSTVLQGRARAENAEPPPNWNWLQPARDDMRRIDQALNQISPAKAAFLRPKSDEDLLKKVNDTTKTCNGVGLLVLGPWSSFQAYSNFLDKNGQHYKFILSQGRSIDDPDKPEWDRVNCHFDRTSCHASMGSIGKDDITWVDLPGPGIDFPVNQEMINKFEVTRPAHTLKSIMERASILEAQQQWDDMPAMYLLRPHAFKREGDHHIPALDPTGMQAIEIELMNGKR